jgi:archaellum component FlaF (FlaF/FlaG flagellin family)
MIRANSKQRRGLSSVVGAVFMVLVMLGALNAILLTMRQQDTITQAVIDKSSSNLNKLNEEIAISDMRVSGNKLNVTVTNTGGATANLKSIYVVNETAKQQYRYDLNLAIDGRNSGKNVGQSLPFIIKNNTNYSVKLVTESGNTATSKITPLSSVGLPMSIYIIPPTVIPGQNVTVLFAVTNNMTDGNLAVPINLKLRYSLSCTVGPSCLLTSYPPSQPNSTMFGKGNTALYKWVFKADVPDKTYITFNASLTNARQGNYVIEKAFIGVVQEAQTSFQSELILSSTLVQKPEIFALFPSPFGNSPQKGIWGVAIANPTDQPMEVNKIIMTLVSPRAQSNDKMVDTGGGDDCAISNISPSGISYWSCPAVNMIMWKKAAGVTIAGRSALTFLASVNPGTLASGSIDLESYSIDVTVFTSMGQFSKPGYSGSIRNSAGVMANVFMSSAVNSTSSANIIGNFSNAKVGSSIKFNATIADLDTGTSNKINSGSRLIIDVPKCFSSVQILKSGDFTISAPVQYPDGSWQISGTLNHDITGGAGAAARTIQFGATVGSVPDTRIYIVYLLADGESDGAAAFPIGPIAEIPVQVIP